MNKPQDCEHTPLQRDGSNILGTVRRDVSFCRKCDTPIIGLTADDEEESVYWEYFEHGIQREAFDDA